MFPSPFGLGFERTLEGSANDDHRDNDTDDDDSPTLREIIERSGVERDSSGTGDGSGDRTNATAHRSIEERSGFVRKWHGWLGSDDDRERRFLRRDNVVGENVQRSRCAECTLQLNLSTFERWQPAVAIFLADMTVSV